MSKRKLSPIGAVFAALIVLAVVFLVRSSMHRSGHVTLPEELRLEETDPSVNAGTEAIRRVEVAPETVQRAVETLARPENYERSVRIERYFDGGSAVTTTRLRAAGGWTRLDTEQDERHVIVGADGVSCVWYGSERRWYEGRAAFTADEEENIPTYEDVLLLESERIAVADYRLLDTLTCIYVETRPDEAGYVERWWISVEDGLLAAAERLQGETVVYRMAGLSLARGGVTAEAFTLPDGTVRFDPGESGEQEEN